jgi:predicted metal-dependent hydrolase
VAFVHLERGNYKGAKKLFRTSCEYLDRYPGVRDGIDVDQLLRDFQSFFSEIVPPAEKQQVVLNLESLDTPKM